MRKKYIIYVLLIFFLLFAVIAFTNMQKANIGCSSIYLTENKNPETSYLGNNGAIVINSPDELNETFNKHQNTVAFIVDKGIINNSENSLKQVKLFMHNHKNNKLFIVIGYGNATYCFLKLLDITNGKNVPPNLNYNKLRSKVGFCVAYCERSGKIVGKSHEGNISGDDIVKIVNYTASNCGNPKKIEDYLEESAIWKSETPSPST